MEFLEKDLEDIIFEALQSDVKCDLLAKRGLDIGFTEVESGYIKPQYSYRQKRIGEYGISDIITCNHSSCHSSSDIIDHYLNINVVELKKDSVNLDTLLQASRYAIGIKSYLKKRNPNFIVEIYIYLIGKTVDTYSDWVYLFNLNDINAFVYEYNYELDGIRFNRVELEGYKLIKEGF